MPSPILAPVMALVLWTFVMQVWLYATRIPAVLKAKVPLDPAATSTEFNAYLPPQVRWKADNYNHLLEQPVLFYATALVLALGATGAAAQTPPLNTSDRSKREESAFSLIALPMVVT